MPVAVELPSLGESVVEGTVSRWLVKEGDRVAVDQPLVEVTTDKVDAEIPSPAAGVVQKILVAEGQTVAVGAPLAMLETEGESKAPKAPRASEARSEPKASEVPEGLPQASEGGPPQSKQPGKPAGPAAAAAAPAPQAPERPAPPPEPPAREAPPATPLARRLAEEAKVDLRSVTGTGASGRVTKQDVVQASRRETPASPGTAPAGGRAAYLNYSLQPGDRVVPMSPLRKLVAEHMVLSKRVSPHVGTVAEIDMSGVSRVRDAHKRSFEQDHGFGLSFLPFVVHATVRALREYPRLNASVVEDAIVEKKDIHIGIAVETEKGLVVPVVRQADRLSLAGLAQALEDLASRARSKKLSADELKGGTFTISNPGRHGNLYGFAIINQPQVGILRMGEIVKRPVVHTVGGEDAIVIRPIMHLALSYDHRAVDGAPANGFLHRIRELLEEAEFDL
jgi:2-oxoglutarate dehydrogenase E2 component (dihydrolipoamide succinyltransferase)